ncbi:MAG: tetratricopeptide repeat protein [Candidatus Coatesbacteria bacterium]|nr:tetratricopeptide repeat protein [Candidatus Coatesbacteria bacterium]
MARSRKLCSNLLALLIGVLLVFALEGALRIARVPAYTHMMRMRLLSGHPGHLWEGRSFGAPVFELQTDSSGVKVYSTSTEQAGLPIQTQSFPAKKGPSTRRVFCFGESSMYGVPYSNNVATLSRWMQEFFDRACQDYRFEVINCGVSGIDSYGIVEIARECLQYEPDIFVVFSGHNERARRPHTTRLAFFRGSRAGHSIRRVLAPSSRIYSVMARLFDKVAGPTPQDADAALAGPPGLSPEEEEVRDRVTDFEFDCNLQEIADMARDHAVGLVLAAPCPNYRDWPAFDWRFGPDASQDQRRELMMMFWRALSLLEANKPQASAIAFKELIGLRPDFSAFYFWLGRSYEEMGDTTLAKENYFKAIDKAIDTASSGIGAGSSGQPGMPLAFQVTMETRMTLGLRDTMEKAAARNSVPFVDLFSVFEAESPNGLVGNNLIMDACHPSLSAHKIAAKAILQKCQASGLIPPECNLDRFDQIMAQFTEDDLSWLPPTVSEKEKENWPRAKPEMTVQAYMSRVAEWLGDDCQLTHEFGRSAAWFRKGLELAPNQASLQKKLDDVRRLMGETAAPAARG